MKKSTRPRTDPPGSVRRLIREDLSWAFFREVSDRRLVAMRVGLIAVVGCLKAKGWEHEGERVWRKVHQGQTARVRVGRYMGRGNVVFQEVR